MRAHCPGFKPWSPAWMSFTTRTKRCPYEPGKIPVFWRHQADAVSHSATLTPLFTHNVTLKIPTLPCESVKVQYINVQWSSDYRPIGYIPMGWGDARLLRLSGWVSESLCYMFTLQVKCRPCDIQTEYTSFHPQVDCLLHLWVIHSFLILNVYYF